MPSIKLKKFFSLRVIVLFCLLLITGIGVFVILKNFQFTNITQAHRNIRIGIVGQPLRINPLYSSLNSIDDTLTKLVYRSAVQYDESGHPIADLADKWDITEDGKTYTLTIKPDQLWRDKHKITADDFMFTYQVTQKEDYNGPEKSRFQGIQIEKIDDLTIKFTLKERFSPFLENLTLGILPEHIWRDLSSNDIKTSKYNLEPVGSGDYAITHVTTEVTPTVTVRSITLGNNQQQPRFKEVQVNFYQSDNEVKNAYALGEIDSFYTSNLATKDYYTAWQNTTTRDYPICGQTISMFYNLTKDKNPLTTNEDFRSAMFTLLISVDGHLKPLDSPISSNQWAYDKPTTDNPLNLDQSKEIIKASQIDTTLKLITADVEPDRSFGQDLISFFRKEDIKVELELATIDQLKTDIIPNRSFDLLVIRQKFGHDPDQYQFWHSTQTDFTKGGMNVANYINRSVDKSLEEGRKQIKDDERKENYAVLQRRLYVDQPAVFFNYPSIYQITRKNINAVNQSGCVWHESDYLSQSLK